MYISFCDATLFYNLKLLCAADGQLFGLKLLRLNNSLVLSQDSVPFDPLEISGQATFQPSNLFYLFALLVGKFST